MLIRICDLRCTLYLLIFYLFLFLHQGSDSVLELFTVLSEEEVQKKMTKKLKKAKKKAAK